MPAQNNGSVASGESWHVSRQGARFGPYQQEELLQYIEAGNVVVDDLVWSPSLGDWHAVKDVAALSRALPVAAAPVAAARRSWFARYSRYFRIFLMVSNPGVLLKSHLKHYSWHWALTVSGLAFLLFFFQTSLDVHRTGAEGAGYVVGMSLAGLLFGTLGVAFFAALTWLIVRRFGGQQPVDWAVKAFGLGYAPALVYTTCGLLFNIFLGWNTALTFGIPGVLWATRPMLVALREMTGGKKMVSLLMSVFFGLLLFMGWSWLI